VRSLAERRLVAQLASEGLNDWAIARETGIPRETIRDWRRPRYVKKGGSNSVPHACPRCDGASLPAEPYSYLLGLHLGDGCLSLGRRGVYRLQQGDRADAMAA
jgi:Homeodomain-like domain